MLKILEVEGAIERAGQQVAADVRAVDLRRGAAACASRRSRRAEQAAMETYGRTGKCLMEFLLQQLDDPGAEPCGRCMACTGSSPAVALDAAVVAKAREHLRWAELMVEPRLQWPSGSRRAEGPDPRGAAAPVRTGAERVERRRVGRAREEGSRGGGVQRCAGRCGGGARREALAAGSAADVGDVRAVVRCESRARVRRATGGRARPAVPPDRREDARDEAADGAGELAPAVRERVGRVRGRGRSGRGSRCCWSTTSSTRAGRSRWSAPRSSRPEAAPSRPSSSRSPSATSGVELDPDLFRGGGHALPFIDVQ